MGKAFKIKTQLGLHSDPQIARLAGEVAELTADDHTGAIMLGVADLPLSRANTGLHEAAIGFAELELLEALRNELARRNACEKEYLSACARGIDAVARAGASRVELEIVRSYCPQVEIDGAGVHDASVIGAGTGALDAGAVR
jgi:hypothetical protein